MKSSSKIGQSTNFAEYSKLVHGVYNTEKRWDGFGFLADFGLVNDQLDAVVLEVSFHLLAIDVVDI